ncbi:MAG TPA: glycosyltransferase [Polyangiaceae bacterium]|jgi:glycosyltransferase involved in cell wall biosynthesis
MTTKVCYIAGREGSYSRTHNVQLALERAGLEVVTCFPANKAMSNYPKLIGEFLARKRGCDLVVVGFYGQLLLPIVRLFTRRPILFDVYVSTFGTMVDDRGKARASSLKAKLYWFADHLAMRWADHIILESNDHIRRYSETYRVPADKFTRMFLPSDESIMVRREPTERSSRFLVHFHGEYAPFHGVDVIIRAAKALEHEEIEFQIVGKGITYARDRRLAEELGVQNVRFLDPVPYAKLAELMSRADVCLGFFGDNPRGERVFTNKVVEALALGQPLITRRNAAVQELLCDGESALLIEPGSSDALARAILRLKNQPELRERLGKNARRLFEEHCTQAVFAGALARTIEGMLAHAKSD